MLGRGAIEGGAKWANKPSLRSVAVPSAAWLEPTIRHGGPDFQFLHPSVLGFACLAVIYPATEEKDPLLTYILLASLNCFIRAAASCLPETHSVINKPFPAGLKG